MESKIYLATLITASTVALSAPVNAQPDGGNGARFVFAPNYFKQEQNMAPLPGKATRPENGNVPKNGASFLGLSPQVLEKAKPVVQTTVAAKPLFSTPSPQASQTPAANQPPSELFGKPGELKAPVVAKTPDGSTSPGSAGFQPASKHAHPAGSNSVKTGVRGKLLTRVRHADPDGLLARQQSASYGKDVGYSPGPFVPSSDTGLSAKEDVYGKLLHR